MKRRLPQLVRSAPVVYPHSASAPNIAGVTRKVEKIDRAVKSSKTNERVMPFRAA